MSSFARKYEFEIKSLNTNMKKYLLLVEDEALWAKFKESIQKDINSEILELIEEKVKSGK